MNYYKVLNKQVYTFGKYSIVPLRTEDRYEIMKWRNEQMYHLRQNEPLTKEKQDSYFDVVISKLFETDKPDQILFSYLEGKKCIGYGGLVHINWVDKHAEISFIMDTELEKEYFDTHWSNLLNLIEQVATKLKLHKIFTYAYDLRPHLYSVLENNNYRREAVLNEHCFFEDKYLDVIIHSKMLRNCILRKATKTDVDITFRWVNDPEIRSFSYNQNKVSQKNHTQWFYSKLHDTNCEYYILENHGTATGSLRFDFNDRNEAKISYLIDSKFKGKGLGTTILKKGIISIKNDRPDIKSVFGYVLEGNKASIRIFEKLKFDLIERNDSEFKYEKEIK
ncbi:RimJ/RimL family protein N-acetyltransferase [Gillisia sp. Hel_I_86]|uniref:GNAT family N-acetyltransferase n=1 Tax=Gillisia sp. Hel_I_86 TaxID=1249981 RepID=UPI0011991BCB|nr:GNAT family N-acetyltransferase [Gillisia sp. Hel_I_86]TVZ28222.1 RimJ/RimL family protein N-acetyltransferase [Gillisia sp. Hel_I_86]